MAGSVSKEALLKILGNNKDALAKLEEVDLKAEELKKSNPTITPQIDAAKARAETALLKAELKRELGTIDVKVKPDVSELSTLKTKVLGWLTANPFSAASGSGGGGILSTIGSFATSSPYALAAVAAAVASALVEVTGLVSGFAAATLGVGAFAAVALPTYQKLTGDIAAVHAANEKFQESALNVDTAIQTSAADAQAYNAALKAMPANLASAAKLLGDQNGRWQDLTTSQQNNVTALANNSAAVKSLLPSQKTALTALIAAKTAWDDMSPGQQAAAASLNQVANSYQKIVAAVQPTVLKVIADGMRAITAALPALQPFAQAGGNAIDGLLKHVTTFFQSADFKKWLDKFEPIVAPAITAIGTGIGGLAVNMGKLLTVLPAADDIRAIGYAFDALNGSLIILTGTVKIIMGPLSALASVVSFLSGAGGNLPTIGGPNVANIPNLSGLGKLGGPLPSLGKTPTAAAQGHHLASGGYGSGLTLVGERGPELLNLPGGSYVFNAQKTKTMLAAGSAAGGGGTVRVQLEFAGGDGPIIEAFKRAIRLRGGGGPGSVQVALGQG